MGTHGSDVSVGVQLLSGETLLQVKNSTGHRWGLEHRSLYICCLLFSASQSSELQINGRQVQSIVKESKASPLTINSLYSDDEEEATAHSGDCTPKKEYFLDEDNTLDRSTLFPSFIQLADTTTSSPTTSEYSDGECLTPREQVKEPLSCSSAEEVAIRQLTAQYDLEAQVLVSVFLIYNYSLSKNNGSIFLAASKRCGRLDSSVEG